MFCPMTFNLVVGSGAGFVGPRVCSLSLSSCTIPNWLNGLYVD